MSNITPPNTTNEASSNSTASKSSNKLVSYKLTPPTDKPINPLINPDIGERIKRIKLSKDYPDFLPWVHTNPKINNIYLNNLINGYTTSDLLSKNPLNDDRKMYITTNSNSNGNNTSTTSLGENESGFKLFKINHDSDHINGPNSNADTLSNGNNTTNDDTLDLNSVLDNVMVSFKSIRHFRDNKVNNTKLSSNFSKKSIENEVIDPSVFVNFINSIINESNQKNTFISESVIQKIKQLECKDWTQHMITVLDEIFSSSETNELFNAKFYIYWRLFNIMVHDLEFLQTELFYLNWLLPFISKTQTLLSNGTIINEKLPIIKFITLEVVLNFLPNNSNVILNDLLKNLMLLLLPKENKFSTIINDKLINPMIVELFNKKNLKNFKLINETNNDINDDENAKLLFLSNLQKKNDDWISLYNYLKDISNINLEKLSEVQMWNESIALKYLFILPKQSEDSTTGETLLVDHGIKLTPDYKLILTQEYDPENIFAHSILRIISDNRLKFINTFKFYEDIQEFSMNSKFQEEKYWSILITVILKSKIDFNMRSLISLTNYLISLKKLNINNFFLKLISSGVLHNVYIEKFGEFLINLNVFNNLKQYDSTLSKYFKNLFDDYNSNKLKELVFDEASNNDDDDDNIVISVLIERSNNFLNKLLYEDVTSYERINTAECQFIKKYKGQYQNFWVYINHILQNDKVVSFKAFKLILDYIIAYSPNREMLDFNLIFDYYMRLEQSMILKDLQFSETKDLKLQYDFDISMATNNIATFMATDNNIYDFRQNWKILANIYKEDRNVFFKLMTYEDNKQNNILSYNLLKENIPHSISNLKDEVFNHGTLQQFLTKTFREYFHNKNNTQSLTNIKLIKFKFAKTFNNYIPYFIKRLKLDSHNSDTSFFQKLILLINDDLLNIEVLFNRLSIDDIVKFINHMVKIEDKYPLTRYQISCWILKNDDIIIKILNNKNMCMPVSCFLVNRFIKDKFALISKWLINEKALLCDLLNIDYNDWFLKLNEENIFTQLIYKLNFTNFQYMKLLLNEFINNLNIEEIMNIIENLHGDFIIKNFLIIDFNTIEDFGNHLLNELLNKMLDYKNDKLLIHLINNNIKLNEHCLKNFTISQTNLKKIITKLSSIKQNNDQASLEKIFQVMLLYNIKDIKLNIKNNNVNKNGSVNNTNGSSNGMSLKNRILACLVNDKLHLDNDTYTSELKEETSDAKFIGIDQPIEVIYLRSNK